MKTILSRFLLILSLGSLTAFADETNSVAGSGPGFYIGQSAFPLGDSIVITSVDRSADRLVVKGHYNLVSSATARLALYTTTSTAISVPTASSQSETISQGSADFELIDPNLVPGMNHVSMYAIPGGKSFAVVYFGNPEEAAAESQLDLAYVGADAVAKDSAKNLGHNAPATPVSTSGPNQALLAYLGNPVEPPVGVASAYRPQGLTNAIQTAAGNAGIMVKKVAVDDSEFPFLIGVTCSGADFSKLKEQLRKMGDYEYNGSIGNDVNSDGSDTCNVFSIVPDRVYPASTALSIYHRLWLRQQVFYDQLNGR